MWVCGRAARSSTASSAGYTPEEPGPGPQWGGTLEEASSPYGWSLVRRRDIVSIRFQIRICTASVFCYTVGHELCCTVEAEKQLHNTDDTGDMFLKSTSNPVSNLSASLYLHLLLPDGYTPSGGRPSMQYGGPLTTTSWRMIEKLYTSPL